jgi:hypothetical protein
MQEHTRRMEGAEIRSLIAFVGYGISVINAIKIRETA